MKLTIKTELITNYIEQNHLTIKEFCAKCQISKNTYYKIMKGNTNIYSMTMYKILAQTNLFCEDILVYE